MAKRIIKLTEQEFNSIVKKTINEVISEIDGATYARVHNASIDAQNRQLNNIPSPSQKRSNIDTILKGIDLDPRAADSFITPFKDTYLFHCQNLRQAAALTVFNLKQLYQLNSNKAILKGDIIFNGEQLYGSIIIDMQSHRVYYNYKGRKPEYNLLIDPSKKGKWENFLKQLDLVIANRI